MLFVTRISTSPSPCKILVKKAFSKVSVVILIPTSRVTPNVTAKIAERFFIFLRAKDLQAIKKLDLIPKILTKSLQFLKKIKLKPSELLRKKDKAYKDLDLKNKTYTESQLLNMMIKNPDLIERPIVAKGLKVMLARPPESVNDLL